MHAEYDRNTFLLEIKTELCPLNIHAYCYYDAMVNMARPAIVYNIR